MPLCFPRLSPGSTPLENSLNKLGKFITIFVLAVTAVIFILSLIARREGIAQNFMTAVAIAVAAIPEGSARVVTIIMAMAASAMSKKHVVIRKLKSVETLGGCNYVCTDKTGTLTENRMRVEEEVCPENARTLLYSCMHACVNVKGERGRIYGRSDRGCRKRIRRGKAPDFCIFARGGNTFQL